jgi:ATP-dependent Zn protease
MAGRRLSFRGDFLIQVHCKNKPLARYINWHDLGGATRGMSGAMIANVVNVAVLEAIRKQRDEVRLYPISPATVLYG